MNRSLKYGLGVFLLCAACLVYCTCCHSKSIRRQNYIKFSELYIDTPLKQKPDSILVVKHNRELSLYRSGTLLKIYHISLGESPLGPKHFQNDNRTPEGVYHISDKNPNSEYHKNLGISYPSDQDRAYATLNHKPTGGDIKIHGMPNGEKDEDWYQNNDWTAGCIAVTNKNIDELYEVVAIGTVINIQE